MRRQPTKCTSHLAPLRHSSPGPSGRPSERRLSSKSPLVPLLGLADDGLMERMDFDVDEFLLRPLTARVGSIGPHGPVVRPVWYLWEHGSFWWLTGPWSSLASELSADPRVAVTVDTCDLARGEVQQVLARGRAQLHAFDAARARRTLSRYLGEDPASWDHGRFDVDDAPQAGTGFVRLRPEQLVAKDLSYQPSPAAPRGS